MLEDSVLRLSLVIIVRHYQDKLNLPNSRKLRRFFIEYKRMMIIIMQADSECETGDSGSY